jgi:hypothetical protein
MRYYRLYFLKGSHFYRFEDFDAADDVDAVRRAAVKAGSEAAELWCGARRVKRLSRGDGLSSH